VRHRRLRHRRLTAVALGLASLAPIGLTVAPAGAATAHFHDCAGSYGPDGTPGQGFYRRIRAKRTGCTTANRVTLAWVKYEAMHDGANPTGRVRIRGYHCRGHVVRDHPGDAEGGLGVLCTRGAKAVAFYGHP
jgi:hypothetical protein